MELAPITSVEDDLNKKIQWDFDLKNEFSANRNAGFAFLIDTWHHTPSLVLYRIGPFNSYTNLIEVQPPQSMLIDALKQQGYVQAEDGLYSINPEIRSWIEKNLL